MTEPTKPEGGYLAKKCAVKAQWDVILPCEPLPVSPFLQRMFTRGMDFERDIIIKLVTLYPDAVFVESRDPENENRGEREKQTLSAIQTGAEVIVDARLPVDYVGRRVGEPDLLVKAPCGGYHAVDIKHHLTLGGASTMSCQIASLETMTYESAGSPMKEARKRMDDLLQLAHYQRLLEAAGFAAEGPRLGGIIGKEQVVVWFDLEPIMAEYDLLFKDRLAIIDIANDHLANPAIPLAIAPVRCSECPQCPWKDHCRGIMEQGTGDLSLIPGMRQTARASLLKKGIHDRGELAALSVYGETKTTASQIDLARAVLGSEIVYRRRGVTDTSASRGDVEVDLDIENDENGVYLWGTLTTGTNQDGYRPFVDWSLLTKETEAALFLRFWAWFLALRQETHDAGKTFRVSVYSAHERTNLRRIATRTEIDPEEFIGSEDYVDLLAIFRAKLITGNPIGLKKTAPLSSFNWDIDEPGGDESMVRHDEAVKGDEAARAWLLSYNESDVRATKALRIWMSEKASSYPSIESLEP